MEDKITDEDIAAHQRKMAFDRSNAGIRELEKKPGHYFTKRERNKIINPTAAPTNKKKKLSFNKAVFNKVIKTASRIIPNRRPVKRPVKRYVIPNQNPQYPNRFQTRLDKRLAYYRQLEAKRQSTALPQRYAENVDKLRQMELNARREFARKHSLLRAHENMNQSVRNCLDPTRIDQSHDILNAPNIFSGSNPYSNVFKNTGRPTILNSPDNILIAKHRLVFGRVNATQGRKMKRK